jgi:hypothetical protein
VIFDNEQQREIILNALMTMPIQGDYQGIAENLPKVAAVVEAVQKADIAEDKQSA